MEEKQESSEDQLIEKSKDKAENISPQGKGGIGIDPTVKEIDQDAAKQGALATAFQLNDELRAEIKALLKEDLDASVSTLISDVKKEGQEVKKDFLTIFGLFASFVTFLSIEVQVFKNKDNIFELLGISSISLAFVMFFALIINDIAKDKSQWSDFKKPTYIINMCFLLVGVIFLFCGGCFGTSRVKSLEQQSLTDSLKIDSMEKGLQSFDKRSTKSDSILTELNNSHMLLLDTLKAKKILR